MIHRESCVCGMYNFEFFQTPPPPNIALEELKWIEYYPVSSTLNSDTAPMKSKDKGTNISLKLNIQLICKFTRRTELT